MSTFVHRHRWKLLAATSGLAILVAGAIAIWVYIPRLPALIVQGDKRDLRAGPEPVSPPGATGMLVLALDGVDRALLYDLLREGALPNTAALLGGQVKRQFAHAHLDATLLAPMPTMTLASWATIFTGVPPAHHGVVGNEYFDRASRRYVGPGPVSVSDPDLVLQVYTDGYANQLLAAPTIYERLRARDPLISSWVVLNHYYRGADRLILADRAVLADAFAAMLDFDDDEDDLEMYASLDREVIESLIEQLAASPAPRLLTVYLAGADGYGHGSVLGPDRARRKYLVEIFDPLMGKLLAALDRQGALDNRYVMVVSDHGQLQVLHDDAHALSTGEDDPPAIVRAAGFRLRPFETDVDPATGFDSVLAYGGAVAFGYLADRSTCVPDRGCDWSRPPRLREDVVPFAEALQRGLGRRLDLVFIRSPAGPPGMGPFEVHVGDGRTVPVDEYLAREPREQYVDVERRLRELAVGPLGAHAGDVLLLARNGNEADANDRYYFSGPYHGWHGSPSRTDSEIPFIVAHRNQRADAIQERIRAVTGARVEATEIADLIEALLLEKPSDAARQE